MQQQHLSNFLEHLSKQHEEEFKIVLLDNGTFHHVKSLLISDNIQMVFLPPYSPELNPAEKVGWMIKRELKMKLFKTIENLQKVLTAAIKKLCTRQTIQQLTAFACYQNIVYTTFIA